MVGPVHRELDLDGGEPVGAVRHDTYNGRWGSRGELEKLLQAYGLTNDFSGLRLNAMACVANRSNRRASAAFRIGSGSES